MIIITYIFSLIMGISLVLSYRQGICDSFFVKNNIPLKKSKEEKEKENEFIGEYEKMMNYSFDLAGEDNADK